MKRIILYIHNFTKNDCSVEELFLGGWGEDSADAHKELLADQFLCSIFMLAFCFLLRLTSPFPF